MKHPEHVWWRRRGAHLLALATLLGLAVWAPVPTPWQLSFRLALILVLYIALVARIWNDARQSFDPDDPQISSRCRQTVRRIPSPRTAAPRTLPLTEVQRTYLSTMAAVEASQQEEETHG
jgi:hypothetical protein